MKGRRERGGTSAAAAIVLHLNDPDEAAEAAVQSTLSCTSSPIRQRRKKAGNEGNSFAIGSSSDRERSEAWEVVRTVWMT